MVLASPDLAIWKLSGEYTTAASILPASKFGTSPPPPTGTRVKSILRSWIVHSASRSEPEPAEGMPTFLPLRSFTSSVDFASTISCQPKLPIEPLATTFDITPFLRPGGGRGGALGGTGGGPAT